MDKKITAIIIYATDCDKKQFDLAKKSVAWCDELVLINGVKGSFNDWRNEGLKKANGDWILCIDIDEEVTPTLQEEIQKIMADESQFSAFAIPRSNIIFGRRFKYSGQYPDYQIRLLLRENVKKWINIVHEEPVFEGKLGYLKNPIIHHKNMTISEMIDKTNKWSEIEANLMIEVNHPPMNIFRFFTAGFREFVLRFIKEKAFMDGKEGIIYGIYQIYSRLISYSKLWEKQQSTIRI